MLTGVHGCQWQSNIIRQGKTKTTHGAMENPGKTKGKPRQTQEKPRKTKEKPGETKKKIGKTGGTLMC